MPGDKESTPPSLAASGEESRKETVPHRDRRRCGRRAVRGAALAWVPNATVEADGIGRQPVVVRNVSLDGARFEACLALPAHAEFVLHVRIGRHELHIPCETVHVRLTGCSVGERIFLHGCRFLNISPRDAQVLASVERIA